MLTIHLTAVINLEPQPQLNAMACATSTNVLLRFFCLYLPIELLNNGYVSNVYCGSITFVGHKNGKPFSHKYVFLRTGTPKKNGSTH